MNATDPHEAIARLEERIEGLAARIENCRKFMLASRAAIALGGAFLAAAAVGVIRYDALALTAGIAAVLGGIVVLGSNRSTTREAAAQMEAAEAARSELIAGIELRVVSDTGGAREAPAGSHRRLH